ncbi:hypothetical protein EJ02DRAFT_425492 [Clathrospora elynae]|uniref:Uncharacterized protein n=1 Tax=Clathrospora elynae TaxID=706981 RepID=A0A6A5SJH8_9PLEO|nr:hypothetical protein EJ02DRAFT_425492 [Clathrospora elynae]
MPALPTLTRRDELAPSPLTPASSQSIDPGFPSDLIAGVTLGVAGLVLIGFWSYGTGYPWYKRVRELKAMRKKGLADPEAVLAYTRDPVPRRDLPPIHEVHSSSSLEQQLNAVQDRVRETAPQAARIQEQKISEATTIKSNASSRANINNLRNTMLSNITELTQPDTEPYPASDAAYRPSCNVAGIPLCRVRDSQASAATVDTTETGSSDDTVFSIGEAVPMRMTMLKMRHASKS